MSDLPSILASLHRIVKDLSPEEAVSFIGALESLKAQAWARLVVASPNGTEQPEGPAVDRLITPEEAAHLLGVKVSWLYRHQHRLPFSRRLSRKCLRFSETGLRKWQATRRA